MLNTSPSRRWEWKPSPFANAFVAFVLRTPLLHRVISRQLTLFTFMGRKSSKGYTIPVGYLRESQRVTILTKWMQSWWRNFLDTAPVELLIERKAYHGIAKVLLDEETIVPLLLQLINKQPNQAGFYGIRLTTPNQPNMDDIQKVASKLVAIQVTLVEKIGQNNPHDNK